MQDVYTSCIFIVTSELFLMHLYLVHVSSIFSDEI